MGAGQLRVHTLLLLVHCTYTEQIAAITSMFPLHAILIYPCLQEQAASLQNLQSAAHLQDLEVLFDPILEISGLDAAASLTRLALLQTSTKLVGTGLLPVAATLTRLVVTGCPQLRNLDALPMMPHLVDVLLHDNGLEQVAGLARVPHMQRLWVQNNVLRDIQCLKSCQALREINAGGNLLVSAQSIPALAALEVLNLGGNPMASLEALLPLADQPKLQRLSLADASTGVCGVCEVPSYRVTVALALPHLQVLDDVVLEAGELAQAAGKLSNAGDDIAAAAAAAQHHYASDCARIAARRSVHIEEARSTLGSTLALWRAAVDVLVEGQAAVQSAVAGAVALRHAADADLAERLGALLSQHGMPNIAQGSAGASSVADMAPGSNPSDEYIAAAAALQALASWRAHDDAAWGTAPPLGDSTVPAELVDLHGPPLHRPGLVALPAYDSRGGHVVARATISARPCSLDEPTAAELRAQLQLKPASRRTFAGMPLTVSRAQITHLAKHGIAIEPADGSLRSASEAHQAVWRVSSTTDPGTVLAVRALQYALQAQSLHRDGKRAVHGRAAQALPAQSLCTPLLAETSHASAPDSPTIAQGTVWCPMPSLAAAMRAVVHGNAAGEEQLTTSAWLACSSAADAVRIGHLLGWQDAQGVLTVLFARSRVQLPWAASRAALAAPGQVEEVSQGEAQWTREALISIMHMARQRDTALFAPMVHRQWLAVLPPRPTATAKGHSFTAGTDCPEKFTTLHTIMPMAVLSVAVHSSATLARAVTVLRGSATEQAAADAGHSSAQQSTMPAAHIPAAFRSDMVRMLGMHSAAIARGLAAIDHEAPSADAPRVASASGALAGLPSGQSRSRVRSAQSTPSVRPKPGVRSRGTSSSRVLAKRR